MCLLHPVSQVRVRLLPPSSSPGLGVTKDAEVYLSTRRWSDTGPPTPPLPGLKLDLTEDIPLYPCSVLWPAPPYCFPLEELSDDDCIPFLLPELIF